MTFIGGECGKNKGRRWAALVVAFTLVLASPSRAGIFPFKDDDPGADKLQLYEIRKDDTLLDVARRYDVGYTELVAANPGVDPWVPGVGRYIRVPSYFVLPDVKRQGIVINLAEQRLYYFNAADQVTTYPVGIGETGHTTPLGITKVRERIVDPVWVPTPAIRQRHVGLPSSVPPGPDNPLGAFALRLGWPEYLIHGTNDPDTVGHDASNGCMRLYPEDIGRLFPLVPLNTRVQIVRQDVVGAWVVDRLVIEVFPNQQQAADISLHGKFTPTPPRDLTARVKAMLKGRKNVRVDWEAVKQAGVERTGLPVWVARMEDLATPSPQVAAE